VKIWFDVLTPKQALFCHALAKRFAAKGYEVAYTTRKYDEVQGKMKLLGLEAAVIGSHGGANRYDKLKASAERVVKLAGYVHRKLKPDIGFAFASPESARVAFGLGIPYFTANDSPHSRFVAHLTIPFADILFTPWFMKRAWRKLGVPTEKMVFYKGLDPVAWLRDFVPDRETIIELGIKPYRDYVVIRPEEAKASYIADVSDEKQPKTTLVAERILQTFPEVQIVMLCRYREQRKAMHRRFGDRIIIPQKVVDAPSLIALSALLVGAGGTMNQEAALFGVPVISCYPGQELEVEKFLIKKKLLYRIPDSALAAEKAIEILQDKQRYQMDHLRRASALFSSMENPADVIPSWVQKYLES
jgi:predicted glycosyltransferase